MAKSTPTRVLRIREVEARVGFKRSWIYDLERAGRFPRRFKITGGHSAGWVEAEVEAFIQQRIAESRGQSVAA
jgi:prophage regulatory protein